MMIDAVLAALYLRGVPRALEVRRRGWPCVERTLRRANVGLGQASEALRQAGLWTEALVLEEPGLLAWAEGVVARGQCLTAASEGYPARWRRVLGDGAPAALWREGPPVEGPLLGVVGSRAVGEEVLHFAREVAREGAWRGFGVVSGGAKGCDAAAGDVAGTLVEILPCGLGRDASNSRHLRLSACAPGAPFSSAAAMERNGLVYAASEGTVVVHARFRAGGTWAGATDALRRRLCPVLVREDPQDLAHRALIALGGRALREPGELGEALRRADAQGVLALA